MFCTFILHSELIKWKTWCTIVGSTVKHKFLQETQPLLQAITEQKFVLIMQKPQLLQAATTVVHI